VLELTGPIKTVAVGATPYRAKAVILAMGSDIGRSGWTARSSSLGTASHGARPATAADKAGYLPGGVTGAIQRVLDRLTYGTAALLSPAPQPGTLHTAIARAHATRFLLIAAGQGVDEPQAVAYLRTAAPDRVQTWTVPGASHVHGLATAPAQWTTRVIGFLDQALGRTR
jgi:uncharacterized protein